MPEGTAALAGSQSERQTRRTGVVHAGARLVSDCAAMRAK